jgi:hypothetical protein
MRRYKMNKEFEIYLSEEEIKNTINTLDKNQKYIILGGNLLSIDNIMSCFEVEEETNSKSLMNVGKCYFKFSYNDEIIKKLVNVNTIFEQNLVYGFLQKSNYMDYDQLEILVKKVEELVKNGENVTDGSLNNNLYNEALIFVTSGINNNECKNVKDDFESKFKIYKEKQIKINENIIKLMNDLHDKLISIKVK